VQQGGAARQTTSAANASSSSGSTVAVKTSRGSLLLCDSSAQMIWAEQLQLRRPQLMLLLLHLQW